MTPRRKPNSARPPANGSTPTRRSNSRRSFQNPRSAASGCRSDDIVEVGKAWQKKKADGGWACLHWPKEYGGRGATPIERVIWQQEEGVYGKLTQPFQIGEGMCGPTVMAYGSEEHKRHYLPKLASGEQIWCQLFSEPAGGSDVAGLRTRAEKKGDNWIVNGQKIWTSGAHYSDYGLLITRTDPNVPKHKGLTMFFLDMKSKGVEVRPIKQANGMQEFNEVYFTDVVIPDQPASRRGRRRLERVADHADERADVDRLAACDRLSRDVRFLLQPDDRRRARDRRSRHALEARQLGGEGERAEIHQLPRDLGAVEGRAPGTGEFDRQAGVGHRCCRTSRPTRWIWKARPACFTGADEEEARGQFQQMLLSSPSMRIAGGTDEILRNIIAERVLGLPGDIRVDKDVPFNKIPTKGR